MKDRIYSTKTRVTYKDVKNRLIAKGYKCVSYGDIEQCRTMGIAYYSNDKNTIKLVYEWVQVEPRHYVSGKMVALTDVTECY